MHEINLGEAKIKVDGVWFSADDLAHKIQEKINAGDMKFADLAEALEQLQDALENATTLDVKILLTKEEYEKLKSIGGENDRDCVTKAIMAFIGGNQKMPDNIEKNKKKLVIKCPKCKAPIEITSDDRPLDVECSTCGTGGRLTPENKWAKLS
jgi:DNA-directed RNA polymerase subunit RPC12/RpoP